MSRILRPRQQTVLIFNDAVCVSSAHLNYPQFTEHNDLFLLIYRSSSPAVSCPTSHFLSVLFSHLLGLRSCVSSFASFCIEVHMLSSLFASLYSYCTYCRPHVFQCHILLPTAPRVISRLPGFCIWPVPFFNGPHSHSGWVVMHDSSRTRRADNRPSKMLECQRYFCLRLHYRGRNDEIQSTSHDFTHLVQILPDLLFSRLWSCLVPQHECPSSSCYQSY